MSEPNNRVRPGSKKLDVILCVLKRRFLEGFQHDYQKEKGICEIKLLCSLRGDFYFEIQFCHWSQSRPVSRSSVTRS